MPNENDDSDQGIRDRLPTAGAWIFTRDSTSELPEPWRERAVTVWLLPLTPDEARDLFQGSELRPQLSPGDAEIASLLAKGMSPAAIASRTGKSLRTVHRRLAGLRELLQTTSTAQLAVLLASRGF
jgi:DNA-binding NarL/FixJ family response regulator